MDRERSSPRNREFLSEQSTETGNGKSVVRHISSMNPTQPTQTATNHKKELVVENIF